MAQREEDGVPRAASAPPAAWAAAGGGRHLRALVDTATDALVSVSPRAMVLCWNAAAQGMLGYPRGTAEGASLSKLAFSADEAAKFESALETLAARGDAGVDLDVVARHLNGDAVPLRLEMRGVRDATDALEFAVLRLDATRRSARADNLTFQADFTGLLEAAPDAMLSIDPAGRIVHANRQAERLFGYAANELVGQSMEVLVPERFRLAHAGYRTGFDAHPRRRTMGTAAVDLHAIRKDGTEFPTEISLSPLRVGDQVVTIAAIRDITERKRREVLRHQALADESRRAHEASRLKSEFLANMSHELRTPLNAIIGFAELMYDGKVGPVSEDHREYLADILTSSRHLLQLINDVLDLAKVEAGKMEFRPERVDLRATLAEVLDILRPIAAKKNLRTSLQVDPTLAGPGADIVVDPSRLKQVLYNYLSNALKFTAEGGSVAVRAVAGEGGTFRIEVEDTGIGIEPEQLESLFQEFKQLDASAGKRYQGTGLGLSLTKRIVEAQGGRVGATSEPGRGSVFYAALPRVSRVGAPESSARNGPRAILRAGAPTVLVVEDEPADRAWITNLLLGMGYGVQTAATGAEAIALCGQRAFDAITLDLLLPDGSGWDVLRAVRASGPNARTPTVVVSLVGEKHTGVAYGIQDYLRKGVDAHDLGAALRRAGVSPNPEQPVLLVDDDPVIRKLVERSLAQEGYRCRAADSGEAGLRAAIEQPPAAVVLDLLLPGMDGFEFLERFRASTAGARTPVIVWSAKDLSREERQRLTDAAQVVLSKAAGGATALLSQLRIYLPPAGPAPAGA